MKEFFGAMCSGLAYASIVVVVISALALIIILTNTATPSHFTKESDKQQWKKKYTRRWLIALIICIVSFVCSMMINKSIGYSPPPRDFDDYYDHIH